MLLKHYPRRILGSIYIALIVMSVFMTVAHLPAEAQGSTNTLPVVAIHVSENTESIWPTLLPAHPHTDWAYFAIYESLEEVLRSDGTPFVEVNDSLIESGGLLSSGEPKYPILISLAAECISDLAASQILQYVSSGGFAYVGSSAWTRYSNGTARSNFALSAEMGVRCVAAPPSNWNQLTYVYRNGTNRLVDFLPPNVNISPWNLPLDNGTSIQNTGAGNGHYFWQAYNTGTGPAEIVLTIPSSPSPYVMLATKAYSNGRFIYHSELTPMIGFSIYAPQMYEYTFFRRAIEWAFEARSLPLARLSPWPYQYDSAFIIRHDGDSGSSFVLGSAQRERQLGVTGQYYIMTGLLLDDSNNASLITQLQQAQNLYGAQIGPHNGGLNSHYWLSTNPGDYAYYHWGPDICIVRNGTGDYPPYNSTSQPNPGHGAVPTNLYGKDYANMSIKIALDNLTTWLGQRPVIWVSPWADSSRDDSLEVMESQGIKTAGERNFGPFPHVALSLNTKDKYYDIIEFPSQPWFISSGAVYQRLEEHSYGTGGTMQQMIDFLYSMGAMVNMYGHVSSSGGIGEAYINYSKSKPNMWNATPTLIRDWWLQRNPVRTNPVYQLLPDGTRNLTITMTGSTSPNTTVEIAFPASSMNQIYGLQVLVDGVPSSNYRIPATGSVAVKVKVGTASKVTITYKQLSIWTQTSKADFESGTLTNLDTSSVSGQVSLAFQSVGSTLFYDYFNDSSWTSSNWTVQSGTWTTGFYIQNNTGPNYVYSYAGDTSWSNYTVEARSGGATGSYSAQLGGRFNNITGTHYALWVYPGVAVKLLKFTGWTTWTQIGANGPNGDLNWHNLKLSFNGSIISAYYDGTMFANVTDTSYPTGFVDFESYASVVKYDWVTVKNLAGDTVFFSDDFNNATWTNSRWTVYAGTWGVEVEKYLQSDMTSATLSGYKYSHAGDTAWTNYVVEANARYVAGGYGAQIGARLNPSTGAHYAFWIYPSTEGPNLAKLLKFSDWTHWTLLASATNLTTNTNWHILKMVLNGASISCYYDGNQIIQATDSSYTSGKIDLETATATVEYDWITVKQPSSYYSSGTLVSNPFDTGFKAQWMNISRTASLQGGTEVKSRTRTASTQGGLASAAWSDYYTVSGAAITSPANRWIQYEATLSTSNTFVTPILYDVTISYMELSKHDLTIVGSGYGTTDPTPGVYSIYEGEQQMVTAYPDTGYALGYWDLDGTNVGNSLSYTVTMDKDHTLTAYFIELLPTQYGLLVEVSGSGTTNSTGTNMYDPDTVVYVEAFPASSWAFSHWLRNGTDVGSSNPIEITMTENINLTAIFTAIQHTLNIVASGSGTTDPVPGVYVLNEGSSQTVTAVPDYGFVLGHWDLDGTYVGDDSSYTVTIDADHTLTAVFVMRAHVYVDPPLTEKTAEEVYSTFKVNVTIEKVQDLWGFDFNLTWDDTITTLVGTDFNSSLDGIWGHNGWYVAFTENGTGYYELAAVSTSGGYSTTAPTTLLIMEFYVKNTPGETTIHLAMVKLSNSFWRQIKRDQTDGVYRFIGPAYRPMVQMNPTTATCRKSEETFDVQINVTNALRVQGFNFEIHYNASLINYVSVTWGNLGTGTITIIDNQNGVLAGNVAGPSLSQNLWLLNVTFKVNQTIIWHAGATNRLDGEIWFHDIILNFSGGSQLQREEGGINQIDTQPASYSFMPIQGDVDNNGTVNVFDLRAVAIYYDVTSSDPEWTVASKFDLNGDLTIDIYDLVVVGANFGFAY